MTNNDIFNKGVPIEIPISIDIHAKTLLEYAKDEDEVQKYISKYHVDLINYIDSLLSSKSTRFLNFYYTFINHYNREEKKYELTYNPLYILYSMFKYFNIDPSNLRNPDKRIDAITSFMTRVDDLKNITSAKKLEKQYPALYKVYLMEKELNNKFNTLINRGYSEEAAIKALVSPLFFNNDEKIKQGIEDTKKMYSTKEFCNLYSNLFIELFNNYKTYSNHSSEFTIEIENLLKSSFERCLVNEYINLINKLKKVEDKQKYLYYITGFFNEHKNEIYKLIKDKDAKYDISDLYNRYIDILIDNPELKIVNYDRDDFESFTQEEIDEYMDLELKDSKANWSYFEDDEEEERVAKAIFNEVSKYKDRIRREKTIEERKQLYMKKKELFDPKFKYRTVQGSNTFDGYLAFIFPNGKVILERFFERRKDGTEVIATEQAIYVMNILEFYHLTNLSKTKIIRDKLCKRYIHKGGWEKRVSEEIIKSGDTPFEEYNRLVLQKKIKEPSNKKTE